MVSLAEIALEEAIRLGLVPDEKLRELMEQGLLASPFLPGQLAARRMPFWRLPSLFRQQRGAPGSLARGAAQAAEAATPGLRRMAPAPARRGGVGRPRLEDEADFGLWTPRFGLGPLELGLSLSPPIPAFMGGRPPVGRAGGRGTQAPAPLETLLGQGNLDEIARRIEEGLLDPALLPASVMAAVAPLLARAGTGVVARSAPAPAALLTGAPRGAAPGARRSAAQRQPQARDASLAKATQGVRFAQQAMRLDGAAFAPEPFEMSPETREAFEAQRAGERQDFAAPDVPLAEGVPTVGAEFTPEMAAEFEQMGGFGGAPLPPVAPSGGEFFAGPEGTAPPEFGAPRGSAPPPLPPSLGDALLRLELQEAAAEALRTGDASGLPTDPNGQLTPEAVQALADASAGAGGGLAPGGGGPTTIIDPVLAAQMAQDAALAGGSVVPAQPVLPDLPLAEGVPVASPEFTPEMAAELDQLGGFGGVPTPEAIAAAESGATFGEAVPSPPAVVGPTLPSGVGLGLAALGAAGDLAMAGQTIAQGHEAVGSLQTAQGVLKAAALVPGASEAVKQVTGFSLGELGSVAALAGLGYGLAQGGDAGERAAAQAVFNGAIGLMAGGSAMLGMAAVPVAGWAFAAAKIAETLINIGLGEYKQGDLSKRIMNAKQTHIAQYGNQAVEEGIRKAPDFAAAARMLAMAPPGTSGQVQFGVGQEYAGMHRGSQAGTTETPQWRAIVAALSSPQVLAEHPDLVAAFIQNLWVQTGPGGATNFDPVATRDYQVYLLSKLPNTPEWIAAKQKILGAEVVDPRDQAARDRAMAAAPELPVEPGFLRANGLRIPTDHQYQWYDGASGIWYDYSPERVAQTLSPWGSGTVFDKTTGQWVGEGGQPRAVLDPAYLDRESLGTPWYRAKAQKQYDEWAARIPPPVVPTGAEFEVLTQPYNPIDMTAFAALGDFLKGGTSQTVAAVPVAPPPAPAVEAPPPVTADQTLTPPPPAPAPAPVATTSATEMPSAAPPPPPAGVPPETIHGWIAGQPMPQAPTGYYYRRMVTAPGTEFVPDVFDLVPTLGAEPPPPEPIASFQAGGRVPQTGLYRLHAGETVIPAEHEQSETIQDDAGRWINVYGRETPKAGQPLPRRYPFERDSYTSSEEAEAAARRRSDLEGRERQGQQEPPPEGRYYLDPKRGMPFEATGNPEPRRVWRLAFDADQLHEAWQRRGKDGWPLLVPASVLEREDWPRVIERARRTQYERVHPAVLLARSVPIAESEAMDLAPYPNPSLEEEARFERQMPDAPVPEPERPGPMRKMPGSRPLSPEEWRGIDWPEPEV